MTPLQQLHHEALTLEVDADAARTLFRAAVRAAHFDAGRTYAEIGLELGLHRTRIKQICDTDPRARQEWGFPRTKPARRTPVVRRPANESGFDRELREARERDGYT